MTDGLSGNFFRGYPCSISRDPIALKGSRIAKVIQKTQKSYELKHKINQTSDIPIHGKIGW